MSRILILLKVVDFFNGLNLNHNCGITLYKAQVYTHERVLHESKSNSSDGKPTTDVIVCLDFNRNTGFLHAQDHLIANSNFGIR